MKNYEDQFECVALQKVGQNRQVATLKPIGGSGVESIDVTEYRTSFQFGKKYRVTIQELPEEAT